MHVGGYFFWVCRVIFDRMMMTSSEKNTLAATVAAREFVVRARGMH